ncbi:transaldolase [Stipitochalara longipes BDJ]|nr:transaldolase [Stipitochalara longipes BDJ]
MTSLEHLQATGSVICCDSADISAIAKYKPHSATTNFSFILAAIEKPEYQGLLQGAIQYGKTKGTTLVEQVEEALDRLLVDFGRRILDIVPGTVSTPMEAKFAFDTEGNVKKALRLIELYKSLGVDTNRVLIKVASTWEGIQACRELSKKGVNINMTLMFSLPQAVAAAEAGAFVISPFVGRVLDWYIRFTGEAYSADNDPGVKNVKAILDYYKSFEIKTGIIAASFRSVAEIKELAGFQYLTISPEFLEELFTSQENVPKKVDFVKYDGERMEAQSYIDDETKFRSAFQENKMAVDLMTEGIQRFARDAASIRKLLQDKILGI